MNRLAEESSPYLRQHRENPVDWYPWGEDAFARARELDRPVLLSVGYSSCHWCHVMAHESFENPDVAGVMNDLFVNIKVDREERPDVDAVYMEAVQAMTGQGGWPMTVFITPDGRPFFGGTYFPRDTFVELMRRIADAWQDRRPDIDSDADRLADAIRQGQRAGGLSGETAATSRPFSPSLLDAGYESLRAAYDPQWGGFGRAPKFPQPTMVEFLLRKFARDGSSEALEMVTTTLDAMASGGIYDHVGGGFARYATDRTWLVPHFEKMLYDNAQLILLYLHGWQVTGEERYRQVVEETVGYLLRAPMREERGGIHSAEDADSEGVEGKFYVWSHFEVHDVAGVETGEWYGVTSKGNWEGHNILWRPERGDLIRPPAVEAGRRRLFETREQRVRPGLDDKVVTEWNGMAITALATAGAAMGRDEWVDAALEIARFLERVLRRPDGRWLRSALGGRAGRHLAYAVDYAWLVEAFTRLNQATGDAGWIQRAIETADEMLDLFWDADDGGLFTTGKDAERLIVRSKDTYDGATPSANSVAALALLRLAALSGEDRFRSSALAVLASLESLIARQPLAFTNFLAAVDLVLDGTTEIAITGKRPDLVAVVQRRYLPNAVLAWGDPYDSPLWEGRTDPATEGKAFVCRNYTCGTPAESVDTLEAQLAGAAGAGSGGDAGN